MICSNLSSWLRAIVAKAFGNCVGFDGASRGEGRRLRFLAQKWISLPINIG